LEEIRRTTSTANFAEPLALIQAWEHADAVHFMAGTAADALETPEPVEAHEPLPAGARRVGPWTLERSLGIGSMGHV